MKSTITRQNFALLLVMLPFFTGCQKKTEVSMAAEANRSGKTDQTIHYIIPNDFVGVIKIMENEKGESIDAKNGEISLRVPQNGLLLVKSTGDFYRWSYEDATYQNGKKLFNGDVATMPSADSVGFFGLWSGTDRSIYYFVGKKDEYDELQKKPWIADERLKSQESRGP